MSNEHMNYWAMGNVLPTLKPPCFRAIYKHYSYSGQGCSIKMRDGLIWEKNHLDLVIEQSKEDFFSLCGHTLSRHAVFGFFNPLPLCMPQHAFAQKGTMLLVSALSRGSSVAAKIPW